MIKKTLFLAAVFSCLVSLFTVSAAQAEVSKCKDTIRVLIVDPYSSGSLLPDAFRKHVQNVAPNKGVEIYGVHSNGDPIPLMAPSFVHSNFDFIYRHDDSLNGPNYQRLKAIVKELAPQVIIPGTESGVLLADQLSFELSKRLGVLTNGVNHARRDKVLMQEALRKAGQNYIPGIRAKTLEQATRWVAENQLNPATRLFPGIVVLKPISSAGTDGLRYAFNEKEVELHFRSLIGTKNQWGHPIDAVLVQKYVGLESKFKEYVPNAVGLNGNQKFTDLWVYEKEKVPGRGEIYKFDLLLPFEGEVQNEIIDYTLKALKVFGLKHGPTHPEVKMTSNGPVLIEVGARMMGSRQPRLVREALGVGQVELTVEAYLDFLHPGLFDSRPQGYHLKKYAAVLNINSHEDGSLFSAAMEENIKKLPGYIRHSFYFKDGMPIPKTVDMNTSLGQVELISDSHEELMMQIEKIGEWEKSGLFKKAISSNDKTPIR